MRRYLFILFVLNFCFCFSQTFHVSTSNTLDLSISPCFAYNPAAVGNGEGSIALSDINDNILTTSTGTEIFTIRPSKFTATRARCRYVEGPSRGRIFTIPGGYSINIPTTETSYYERTSGGALYFEIVDSSQLYELDCNTTSINATSSINDIDVLRWEYRIDTSPIEANNSQNKASLSIDFDNFDVDLNDYSFIDFRYVLQGNVFSSWKTYSIFSCSPKLIPSETVTTNETCFVANDGSITLTFDSNVDTTDSQMRFYVFKGEPNNPQDADLQQNPPALPNPPQTILDPLITLVPVGGGTTNHTGTLIGLEGGDQIQNSQRYYIVYQEVDYTVDPIVVKSFGYTPSFTIEQPSQIIASGSVEVPQFCGDTAKISFAASGGANLDTNGNYSYQYRLNSTSDTDLWNDITANPQPVDLVNVKQTVQIRAQYSANGCFSAGLTLTDNIEAAAPDLILSSPQAGIASSTTTFDGVIRASYEGGSPNYIFALSKWNETTLLFDEVSNPVFNNNTINSTIEFSSLLVGSYRITITDANGCFETTESLGDIQVTTASVPTLSTPTITPITCIDANDATITVNATYPEQTTFFYELRVGANVVRDGSIASTTSTPFEQIISISNLEPGSYSLFVMASVGDFSSVTIPEIINPDPIVVNISAVPFSCFSSTDGALTVTATGATNYEYELSTNRGVWSKLTNGTISVTDPNFYEVTLRNRDNISCVSTTTNQVEVIRPDAISVVQNTTNATTNAGSDGSISLEISGGTPFTTPANPYTITWTKETNGTVEAFNDADASTPYELVGLEAGIYRATVTDANGCNPNPNPVEISSKRTRPTRNTKTFTGTHITCNGQNDGTLTANTQGTLPVTYIWILEDGSPNGIEVGRETNSFNTATINNLGPGTYSLSIQDADVGPLRSANTVTITNPVSSLPL